MQFTPLRSSLLALALFAAPVSAGTPSSTVTADGAMVVAQAGQNTQRIENIRKFLAAGRNVEKLSDAQLAQRLQRARAFQNTPNLPEDILASLRQLEQQLGSEISRRQQAGAAPSGGQDQAAGAQPAKKQPPAQQQAQTGNQGGAEVDAFLASAQPASGLNDQQLRQQMRKAAQLSQTQGLGNDRRQKLRQIVREARTEMAKRQQAGSGSQQQPDGGAGQAQAPAGGGDIAAFLKTVKPAAQLTDAELRQQMRRALELARTPGIGVEQRKQLRDVARQARAETTKRAAGGNQTPGSGSGQSADSGGQQQGSAGGGAPPENADAAAKLLLNDRRDVTKMSDQELRERLANMRELLAARTLSPVNRKALREQLAKERTLLRNRVDRDGGTGNGQNTNVDGSGNTVNNTNVTINNTTVINREVVRVVMNDRRPSRDLSDVELRRRINVYEYASRDKFYSERERVEWRGFVERDRRLLRDRLLAARERRRDDLRLRVNRGDLNIRIGLNFQPDRPPPPRYVFAAEADEEELEDILTAPPRREIERRYSVEDVETNPDLRDAVARIEIDTVQFGFGEGFLREEEIDELDKIAEIMEKILAAHPNEVFMVEGHTDAVGSESANLSLSRERAQAVKEALVTYYVIPPENLKTVGFGERFLKIPTEEAEAENRRVSVARITPLVGELAD